MIWWNREASLSLRLIRRLFWPTRKLGFGGATDSKGDLVTVKMEGNVTLCLQFLCLKIG